MKDVYDPELLWHLVFALFWVLVGIALGMEFKPIPVDELQVQCKNQWIACYHDGFNDAIACTYRNSDPDIPLADTIAECQSYFGVLPPLTTMQNKEKSKKPWFLSSWQRLKRYSQNEGDNIAIGYKGLSHFSNLLMEKQRGPITPNPLNLLTVSQTSKTLILGHDASASDYSNVIVIGDGAQATNDHQLTIRFQDQSEMICALPSYTLPNLPSIFPLKVPEWYDDWKSQEAQLPFSQKSYPDISVSQAWEAVHAWYQDFRYVSNTETVQNRYPTSSEARKITQGVCTHQALAAYGILKELGLSDTHVFITVFGWRSIPSQRHYILTYRKDDINWLLDNDPTLMPMPEEEYLTLWPDDVYVSFRFNCSHFWA